MASPFAAIEARTAAAVLRHASNAQATATTRHGEVVSFAVIFDNGYAAGSVGLAGMASSQPSAMARSADVADLAVGGSIDVNGVAYLVAEIQPDGTGMVTLLLEKAAA